MLLFDGIIMDKVSKFMTDHSEGDKGKEAIMDFQVSWVLRMAADEDYMKDKPNFRLFSRYMLFKLLDKPFPNTDTIVSVKVKKEWENIDICAEVELVNNGNSEFHVLLIENKVYTRMSVKQRDDYPKALEQFFNTHRKELYKPHQVLITCTESESELDKMKVFCKDSKWVVLSVYDIIYNINQATESELFNEFWIYNWGRLND